MAISHALRTPLNSVLGFSDLLLGGRLGTLTPEQALAVQTIRKAGRSLLGIFDDLQDLVRLEAGELEFREDEFDLREPVVEAGEVALPLARARKQILKLRAEDAVPCVGDLPRIRQIAAHLMINAVRFTPEGGMITVTVRPSGAFAELHVEDTGVGIHPAEQALVFEPMRGAGLGLPLVKRFAEGMGGAVSLQSEPGHGSSFSVRIPAPGQPQAETRSIALRSCSVEKGGRR